MDWSGREAITFDCYGTLVDWESGILATLRPLLAQHGVGVDDESILAAYARAEAAVEEGPYRRYREVLGEVVGLLGAEFGFVPGAEQRESLARSLPEWPLFPDTVAALERLSRRYRLGILSNVDDDLFARTAARLKVPFTWVVTAEQVGSYKPAIANFETLIERVGLPVDALVHAAQSLFHDVKPARFLGLATVWVDRRGDRAGGATLPVDAEPDLRVPSLAALADAACDD